MYKPIAPDNEYLLRYSYSEGPKGDSAATILGKSEDDSDETTVLWHHIQPKMMPWRGADIVTTRGRFVACAALDWWLPKNQKTFLSRVCAQESIESEPRTIYLWKVDSPMGPDGAVSSPGTV